MTGLECESEICPKLVSRRVSLTPKGRAERSVNVHFPATHFVGGSALVPHPHNPGRSVTGRYLASPPERTCWRAYFAIAS